MGEFKVKETCILLVINTFSAKDNSFKMELKSKEEKISGDYSLDHFVK